MSSLVVASLAPFDVLGVVCVVLKNVCFVDVEQARMGEKHRSRN